MREIVVPWWRCLDLDSNLSPLIYKSRALKLYQPAHCTCSWWILSFDTKWCEGGKWTGRKQTYIVSIFEFLESLGTRAHSCMYCRLKLCASWFVNLRTQNKTAAPGQNVTLPSNGRRLRRAGMIRNWSRCCEVQLSPSNSISLYQGITYFGKTPKRIREDGATYVKNGRRHLFMEVTQRQGVARSVPSWGGFSQFIQGDQVYHAKSGYCLLDVDF